MANQNGNDDIYDDAEAAPTLPLRGGSKKIFTNPPNSPTGAPQMAFNVSEILSNKNKLRDVPKRASACRTSQVKIPDIFKSEQNNNNKPAVHNKPAVLNKPTLRSKPLGQTPPVANKPKYTPKPTVPKPAIQPKVVDDGQSDTLVNFRSNLKPVKPINIVTDKAVSDISNKLEKTESVSSNSDKTLDDSKLNTNKTNNTNQVGVPNPNKSPKHVPPIIPIRNPGTTLITSVNTNKSPTSPKEVNKTHVNDSEAPVVTCGDKKYKKKLVPEESGFPAPPKPARPPGKISLPVSHSVQPEAPTRVTRRVHPETPAGVARRRLPSLPHDSPASPQKQEEIVEAEDDEIYDDIGDPSLLVITGNQPSHPERVVSLINPMTEEELAEFEGGTNDEYYDDVGVSISPPATGPKQQATMVPHIEEEYDDVSVEGNEDGEVYELVDTMESPEDAQMGAAKAKEDEKEQKRREEREKREKEKKEKEDKKKQERDLREKYKRELKEQKKKEKEEKEIKAKFKLKGDECTLQSGIACESAKGGKLDLSVEKGETLSIIRLENNPAGKFLVKNKDDKIGYVEESNIETMEVVQGSPVFSRSENPEEDEEDIYDEIG